MATIFISTQDKAMAIQWLEGLFLLGREHRLLFLVCQSADKSGAAIGPDINHSDRKPVHKMFVKFDY